MQLIKNLMPDEALRNAIMLDGYEVQVVLDASGSPFEIGENVARRRMERAGVWLTSTNTMIAELVQDAAGPATHTASAGVRADAAR
jgi:hypothetical protein